MRIEMRTTIIIVVLLVGCEHPPHQAPIDTAKIDATEWEVRVTDSLSTSANVDAQGWRTRIRQE